MSRLFGSRRARSGWPTTARGAWLVVAIGSIARAASAHADLDPLHDHRVIALHTTPTRTTLTYTLALSAASTRVWIQQLDKNADDRLTGDEVAALVERARATIECGGDLDSTKIRCVAQRGGAGDQVEVTGADAEPNGAREMAIRFTSELAGAASQAAKLEGRPSRALPTHTIRLSDATRLPRPGDFHVRLSAEGGARVVSVDHKMEMRLSFLEAAFHRDDVCQATTCGLEIVFEGGVTRAAEAEAPRARTGAIVAVVSAALLAAGIGVFALTRRRRPSSSAD